jgi:hypothetical protein
VKDTEGNGRGLIYDVIPAFSRENEENHKTSVKVYGGFRAEI